MFETLSDFLVENLQIFRCSVARFIEYSTVFFATLCICRFLNKNLKGKLNLQRVLIEILNFDWLVAAFNQLQMDFISKFEVFNWNFNENLSWEWDFHSIIHFKRFSTFQIYKKITKMHSIIIKCVITGALHTKACRELNYKEF